MRKKDEPVVVTSLDDFRQNARNRRKHAAYMKKAEAGDPQAWEEAGMDFLLGKAADMGSEDAKAALREIELDSRGDK